MNEERIQLLRAVVGGEQLRGVDAGPAGVDRCREARMALSARTGGLQSFEIVGVVEGGVVFAVWDGRMLVVSEDLYQRALLPLAWERLSGGTREAQFASTALDDPRAVILQLVSGVEHVVRIEYTTRCDHCHTLRTWSLEGAAHRRRSQRGI
jgi:hypothetical protein